MAQPEMARDAEDTSPVHSLLSVEYWTADLALAHLPEMNGRRVEVLRGSVLVAPHAGWDHQTIEVNLGYLLRQAAKRAGFWAVPEINVVCGEDLFIPDVTVTRTSGAGKIAMDIGDVVMLVEIVSGNRRKDLIDRPKVYAAAGVPWFMRVDFRNRIPAVVLHELVDGEYTPAVAAAAGTVFVMKEPFEFTIDPADLLDD